MLVYSVTHLSNKQHVSLKKIFAVWDQIHSILSSQWSQDHQNLWLPWTWNSYSFIGMFAAKGVGHGGKGLRARSPYPIPCPLILMKRMEVYSWRKRREGSGDGLRVFRAHRWEDSLEPNGEKSTDKHSSPLWGTSQISLTLWDQWTTKSILVK